MPKTAAAPAVVAEPAAAFLPLDGSSEQAVPTKGQRAPRNGKGRSTPGKDAEPSVPGEMSSVVYIGHIPHGFYENQLLGFFSQFGKLINVRLSRNQAGKSRHYAFIQFQHQAVAEIAVSAMDGYFLMKQRLHCRVMKTSEVHAKLFNGANRKIHDRTKQRLIAARIAMNRELTPAEHSKRVQSAIKRDAHRQKRIKAAGMDYEYVGLSALIPKVATKTLFEDE